MIDTEPVDIQVFSDVPVSTNIDILPRIHSRAAIAMDTVSGRVLFEKNAYSVRPMASTTKIMTALLALEKGNLDDIVTVSARAARVGGSSLHLKRGEKIKMNDLLYGLMLRSGNDAAIAVAEHIGGTVEDFAAMMTSKARDIGAYNTAFVTPHGLDRPGHYTTAYDLALITRYALKNKKFSEIVGTYSTVISNYSGHNRSISNTNEMLRGYWGADGVKTGYTGKAGRCLVTSVTRNNWRIICVMLGSNSRYQRASDSTKVLNYIFSNYQLKNLTKDFSANTFVTVKKGVSNRLEVGAGKEIYFPLSVDEASKLEIRYDLPIYITAPIRKGEKIGTAVYHAGKCDIKRVDLFALNNLEKKNIVNHTTDIYIDWMKILRHDLTRILF